MNTTGSALDDHEVEARLRQTLAAVMPLLDATPPDSLELPAEADVRIARDGRLVELDSFGTRRSSSSVLLVAAAALLVLAGLTVRMDAEPTVPADGSPSASSSGGAIPGADDPLGATTPTSVAESVPASTAPAGSTPVSTAPAGSTPVSNDPETAGPDAVAPLRLLPVEMPEGFPVDVGAVRTEVEAGQPVPFETKLYAGPGDTPPVVMVIIDPVGWEAGEGVQDMTTDPSWPSYRIDVERLDGRRDFFATGGLTLDQARAVADAFAAIDVDASPTVDLPFELREVPFEHRPELAYEVDWTDGAGRTITMLVESDRGIDALRNGITWPIDSVNTDAGTVYLSRDSGDPQFLQAGIVIDGHAVNVEARGVDADDLVRMVASIADVGEQAWVSRTGGATSPP
jgi:hypothetical protein